MSPWNPPSDAWKHLSIVVSYFEQAVGLFSCLDIASAGEQSPRQNSGILEASQHSQGVGTGSEKSYSYSHLYYQYHWWSKKALPINSLIMILLPSFFTHFRVGNPNLLALFTALHSRPSSHSKENPHFSPSCFGFESKRYRVWLFTSQYNNIRV